VAVTEFLVAIVAEAEAVALLLFGLGDALDQLPFHCDCG